MNTNEVVWMVIQNTQEVFRIAICLANETADATEAEDRLREWLGDELEDWKEDIQLDLPRLEPYDTIFFGLLDHAFQEVDFTKIAEHYLSKYFKSPDAAGEEQ